MPRQQQMPADPWTVFKYEVDMRRETWKVFTELRCDPKGETGDRWTICNAVLESHVLHVRNLCELLAHDKSREDCTKLYHLLDPSDLAAVEPERAELRRAAYEDEVLPMWNRQRVMSMRLLHPGTDRTDEFDYGPILTTLKRPPDAMIAAVEARKPLVTPSCGRQ